MFVKYLEEGGPLSSLSTIYGDQTESSKFGTMYTFSGEKFYFLSFFQNLGISWKFAIFHDPCDVIKLKRGPIRIIYSNCDKKIKLKNYDFFEVSNSFLRPVF